MCSIFTSPIYSRTNGYLKKWTSTLERMSSKASSWLLSTPRRSTRQLEQSLSNLNTAKANLTLAEIPRTAPGLLSKNAWLSKMWTMPWHLQRHKGNGLDAIRQTSSSSRPCSRSRDLRSVRWSHHSANTDIGDLINSGSSGTAKTDLFHISQPAIAGFYVNVRRNIRRDQSRYDSRPQPAEFPDASFQGKLVRTAEAIN